MDVEANVETGLNSIFKELTCDGLVSRPLNTTETGDKHRLHGSLGSEK